MTKPRPHNYQTVTSQGPKVNTFLEQARSVSHIWLLGTPALQITVYTHDGESQAVPRRANAEHAKGGTLTHPWWPRRIQYCRADASESVRIHSGLL